MVPFLLIDYFMVGFLVCWLQLTVNLTTMLISKRIGVSDSSMRQLKGRLTNYGNSSTDDVEGKKINITRKGESFSVSKIWQWSRKDKLTGSSDAHFLNSSTVTSTLPWMNKARGGT